MKGCDIMEAPQYLTNVNAAACVADAALAVSLISLNPWLFCGYAVLAVW